MGLDVKGLVDENITKGSTRVLVIVILFAVVALAGQNLMLNKSSDKYTKELYQKCEAKLDECNQKRYQESQDFINKIEEYNEIINDVRSEIKIKSAAIDKKLKLK